MSEQRKFSKHFATTVYCSLIKFFLIFSFKRFIGFFISGNVQLSMTLDSLFIHTCINTVIGPFTDEVFAMKIRISCPLFKSLFMSFSYVICGDFVKFVTELMSLRQLSQLESTRNVYTYSKVVHFQQFFFLYSFVLENQQSFANITKAKERMHEISFHIQK